MRLAERECDRHSLKYFKFISLYGRKLVSSIQVMGEISIIICIYKKFSINQMGVVQSNRFWLLVNELDFTWSKMIYINTALKIESNLIVWKNMNGYSPQN